MTFSKNILAIFLLLVISFGFVHSHDHGKIKIESHIPVSLSQDIKIQKTGKSIQQTSRLHSHEIRIARGGTYSVTAYNQDDHGSYWQVLEQYDVQRKTKTYKDIVKCGQNIMLYASIVDYYLRTDDTEFGLTTQLLPLVHGIKKDQIDHGVVWSIQCVDKEKGEELHFADKIRLKHDTSGKYISTDGSSIYTEGNCGRGCQIVGQMELHAIQNGHYSEHTVFEVIGGLSFDQQAFELSLQDQ